LNANRAFSVMSSDQSDGLIAQNTLINLGGRVVPLLVALAAIPIVLRGLGPARFGMLSLAWAMFTCFALLDLGVSAAVTKYFAENRSAGRLEVLPKLVWSGAAVQTFTAVTGSVVLWMLVPILVHRLLHISANLAVEMQRTVYVLIVALPAVLICGAFRSVGEALERFDLINAVAVPASALTFIVPLIGVFAGSSLPSIVAGLAVVRYLVLAAYIWLAFQLEPQIKQPRVPDWPTARMLLVFGTWTIGTDALRRVAASLDRFLIVRFAGLDALTFYTAPYELIQRVGFIPSSVGAAAFPAYARLQGQDRHQESAEIFDHILNLLLLGMGTLLGLFALFAPTILRLWLGPAFGQSSAEVLRILAFGLLAAWLAGVGVTYLRAIGRPDLPTKIRLVVTVLELPLVFFLIRTQGIVGAAWAFTAAHLLNAASIFVCCFGRHALPSTAGLARAGKLAGLLAGSGVVIYLPYQLTVWPLALQLTILAGTISTMQVVAWNFALDHDERELMRNLARYSWSLVCRWLQFASFSHPA
jgi:O-antigen/teichoic acid export membrane protein